MSLAELIREPRSLHDIKPDRAEGCRSCLLASERHAGYPGQARVRRLWGGACIKADAPSTTSLADLIREPSLPRLCGTLDARIKSGQDVLGRSCVHEVGTAHFHQ